MVLDVLLHFGRALAALVFGLGVLFHAVNLYGLSPRIKLPRIEPPVALALGLLGVFVLYGLLAPWRAPSPGGLLLPLIHLPPPPQGAVWAVAIGALVVTFPFTFLQKVFGNSDVANIISALRENDWGDLADVAAADLRRDLVEFAVVLTLTLATAAVLMHSLPGFGTLLAQLSVLAIAISPPARYLYRRLVPDPAVALVTLERNFRPPTIAERPAGKRNLVLIYLESLERSYREHPATADAFARMAAFEDAHFSARRMGQVDGLHYSAAGMVGSQCGIPLFPRGLLDAKAIKPGQRGGVFDMSRFLPGVTGLGDILRADGYAGTYLNGSDVEIFSIGAFKRTHGYDRVIGLKPKRDTVKVKGQNTWGVPDSVLFAEAKAELARLSAAGQPFLLSLLTACTHGPAGYPEPGCTYVPPVLPAMKDSLLPAAIRCSIDQTLDLVDEIDRLGIADNTVVAILSDHLAMPNTLWTELQEVGERRSGLCVIKGGSAPAATVSNRPATLLDVYPTILEAMGYRLREGQANLGVSLLSGRPTLAETLGLAMLERALKANRDIKAHVWIDPASG